MYCKQFIYQLKCVGVLASTAIWKEICSLI